MGKKMVGRPQRKVFCQGNTRAGLRKGLKIPCRMKGYPLSDGKSFRCKYHGYQNYDKFNKANYTDETRIRQLKTLLQFRNYTDEQIKEYYYTKTKPRSSTIKLEFMVSRLDHPQGMQTKGPPFLLDDEAVA